MCPSFPGTKKENKEGGEGGEKKNKKKKITKINQKVKLLRQNIQIKA